MSCRALALHKGESTVAEDRGLTGSVPIRYADEPCREDVSFREGIAQRSRERHGSLYRIGSACVYLGLLFQERYRSSPTVLCKFMYSSCS